MSSKIDAGKAAISLFRSILRIHRAKLPPPMRELGDRYLSEEFRSHLLPKNKDATVTEEQWRTFIVEWTRYRDMVAGSADLPTFNASNLSTNDEAGVVTGIDKSGHLKAEVFSELSPDQQERLLRLQLEAAQFGKDSGNTN